MEDKILLAHGSGGSYTQRLIKELFLHHFDNDMLVQMHDAAMFTPPGGRLALTTDSYVITPVVFPGGNIGKLAVCGTVNDLAAAGANPLFLSVGFILEEGLPVNLLTEIVASMAETARETGVKIVTGDTKVVPRGSADKIFINTSGIGAIPPGVNISGGNAQPGDAVIITGTMGDHGTAIMGARDNLSFTSGIKSDCAPLNHLVAELLAVVPNTRVLRDPTRGGVGATLNEIAQQSNVGIALEESMLPVKEKVKSACEILGLDPLYLANEGKMIAVVPENTVGTAMGVIKNHPLGQDAAVIGRVTNTPAGKVYINTTIGGKRLVDMPTADPLPRIC